MFKKKVLTPAMMLRTYLERQTELLKAIQTSRCPSCGGGLKPVAYENSTDLSHYEVAITCKGCGSRMAFDEKGLRTEYENVEKPREIKK